jgi:subtilisin family serine protease
LWRLICKLFNINPGNPAPSPPVDNPVFEDDTQAFWGVHAINALASSFTGKGIGLAILDTGIYQGHPDFAGRDIKLKSFIEGESVEDEHGHGTHCAGIAAGNIHMDTTIRYGTARDVDLYIGKVLSNSGVGSDSGILAGIDWAIGNGCKVISMSLGASVREGERYSNIYNDLAKKAMDMGTLIVAAAGNDSRRRQGIIRPVNHPANCPAILAVGALDNRSGVADFSCGGINPDGGKVDIAAPGVEIYSTWREPHQHAVLSGTSMATPFAAGVAAMLWEAHPDAEASEIWEKLTESARQLGHPARDVGAGLLQAPM